MASINGSEACKEPIRSSVSEVLRAAPLATACASSTSWPWQRKASRLSDELAAKASAMASMLPGCTDNMPSVALVNVELFRIAAASRNPDTGGSHFERTSTDRRAELTSSMATRASRPSASCRKTVCSSVTEELMRSAFISGATVGSIAVGPPISNTCSTEFRSKAETRCATPGPGTCRNGMRSSLSLVFTANDSAKPRMARSSKRGNLHWRASNEVLCARSAATAGGIGCCMPEITRRSRRWMERFARMASTSGVRALQLLGQLTTSDLRLVFLAIASAMAEPSQSRRPKQLVGNAKCSSVEQPRIARASGASPSGGLRKSSSSRLSDRLLEILLAKAAMPAPSSVGDVMRRKVSRRHWASRSPSPSGQISQPISSVRNVGAQLRHCSKKYRPLMTVISPPA
mmetsp:Transcript_2490/g.9843  ORF Transcript_2490/g.9843 Transcript_2490/m.9843 type:complete len:403 (-) Transcript_2490:729-1937(-)